MTSLKWHLLEREYNIVMIKCGLQDQSTLFLLKSYEALILKEFSYCGVVMHGDYCIGYIVWFQGKCTISKHIFSDCYLEHFSQNSWPWLRCPSMLDCKKTLCCHCLNDACQRYVWSAIQGPEPTSGPWWRHQMETFSALLALCAGKSLVIGEFPAQRPLTRSFDVFLDLLLNKPLSKQSWGWWFETLSRSLWCHCNAVVYFSIADNGIFWEI